jgi:hypothetical protein
MGYGRIALVASFLSFAFPALAQRAVQVTVENFTRAETDKYFKTGVEVAGGIGRFFHYRELDKQTVIRANRDTLCSAAVFDLDAGPVTVTLPNAGDRFMSMQIFNEDQYTQPTIYGAGAHTLAKADVGTRYALIGIRTFVDPTNPSDVDKVHQLQDAVKVEQPGGPGVFESPDWDPVSQK